MDSESENSQIDTLQGHFIDNFEVISKLGEGGFGKVFKVGVKNLKYFTLEIIPDYTNTHRIERYLDHLKEKYKHLVHICIWCEYLPHDLIAKICPPNNEEPNKCDSSFEIESWFQTQECKFGEFWNTQLDSQQSYTGLKMQQYSFILATFNSELEMTVENWIEIGNEYKRSDFHFPYYLISCKPRFILKVFKAFVFISKLGEGPFGTLFEMRCKDNQYYKDVFESYALKIIPLPRESDEQDKCIRECLALQKCMDRRIFVWHNSTAQIVNAWKETLPKNFIASIWNEEDEEEEEEEAEEDEQDDQEDTNEHENITFSTQASESFIKFETSLKDCNIIKNNDISTHQDYLFIQMKLCRGTTLKDWMACNKMRTKGEVSKIFIDILESVWEIHLRELIHRDLKPDNIFIDKLTAVVVDFGLATSMHNARSNIDPKRIKGSKFQHTQGVGTTLYMSPEQSKGKRYNHKVDIYALGIIFFELLVPFGSAHERIVTLTNLRNGLYPDHFQQNHQKEYYLLKSMLSWNPKKRPNVHKIIVRVFNFWLTPKSIRFGSRRRHRISRLAPKQRAVIA